MTFFDDFKSRIKNMDYIRKNSLDMSFKVMAKVILKRRIFCSFHLRDKTYGFYLKKNSDLEMSFKVVVEAKVEATISEILSETLFSNKISL